MKIFLILLVPLVAVNCVDIQNYLGKYGYLERNTFSVAGVTDALKKFQQRFGLEVTGIVDDATNKLMNTPRCGLPDSPNTFGHSDDYRWPNEKENFTYSFENFLSHLTESQIKILTKRAFRFWSDVTDVTFKEVRSAGDITILFDRYYHSDVKGQCPYPFDNKGGTLAHAFFPPGGRMHFDADEHFTNGTSEGTNYLHVTTHEIGHLLGLGHDTVYKDSIMQPYIPPYNPDMKLGILDKWRIQALYNRKVFVCEDRPKDGRCARYKKKYNCSGYSDGWTKYMKKECAKTCSYC